MIETLRVLLAQTTVVEEDPGQQALPDPNHKERGTDESTTQNGTEQGTSNYERVRAYLERYPHARVRDVALALKMSVSTANKWMNRVRKA